MFVEEIMTPNPITVEATAPLTEAFEKLLHFDVRHLIVTSKGEYAGMLSDRDLRRFVYPKEGKGGYVLPQVTLREVMRTDAISLTPETSLVELVDLMLTSGQGALPVLDGNVVCGIVTFVDIIKAVRTLFDD